MSKLFSSLFLISFVGYLIFATIEEFVPGFVTNYFSPHFLLIPVIVFLVILLVQERAKAQVVAPRVSNGVRGMWGLIFFAAFVTLGILWFGAHELTYPWRALVAVYGAVVVTGILSVLLKE